MCVILRDICDRSWLLKLAHQPSWIDLKMVFWHRSPSLWPQFFTKTQNFSNRPCLPYSNVRWTLSALASFVIESIRPFSPYKICIVLRVVWKRRPNCSRIMNKCSLWLSLQCCCCALIHFNHYSLLIRWWKAFFTATHLLGINKRKKLINFPRSQPANLFQFNSRNRYHKPYTAFRTIT